MRSFIQLIVKLFKLRESTHGWKTSSEIYRSTYIDHNKGCDLTGDGTILKPYKTWKGDRNETIQVENNKCIL